MQYSIDYLEMETHFKVLVASSIRRKKPWSRIQWIGNMKESVCLMDKHRASILYLPSGHTKRVIDVFKPHKKKLVCITTSTSGEYVVACLSSGDILHWHKDSNTSVIIPACPNFNWLSGKSTGRVNLFVSDNGQRIVSIVQNHQVNVWEQTGFGEEGEWTNVTLDSSLLTSLASKETSIDATFFTNQVQGSCFLCTFAFSDSTNVNLCFLLIHWSDDPKPSPNAPTFVTSFSRTSFSLYNLHPECRSLRVRGCYVPRLSHNGHMVSLAINQLQPYLSSIFFVDVYQLAAIATSLQFLYSEKVKALPSLAKTYWIKMMTWTYDDLFLLCITGRGSLLLFNNAGEPMMFATHGLGVELGPDFLLPINPLVETFRNLNQRRNEKFPNERPNSPISMASTLESEKSLKQKFSVTCHPRLPIVLCSDGYLVTVLQMTTVVTPHDIAAFSLVETNHKMKILIDKFNLNVECCQTPRYGEPIPVHDEAKFKEYKYTRLYLYIKDMLKRKKGSKAKEALPDDTIQTKGDSFNALVYEFEKAEKGMGTDTDPDSTEEIGNRPTGVIEDADEGKITFGDYSRMTNQQESDEKAEVIKVDGETLVAKIREATSKILSIFALLLLESNSVGTRKQVDGIYIEDKLHLYFIDTLQTLCKLILVSQENSLCLPWKLDDNRSNIGDVDYRDQFDDSLKVLSRNLAFLAQFNTGCSNLVWKSIDVVVGSILQLSTNAPEGCTSIRDIHSNIAAVLYTLTEVGKNLSQTKCLHANTNKLQNPDGYHSLDVLQHKTEYLSSDQSSCVWEKFHSYLSTILSLPSQQSNSAFYKAIRMVQLQLRNEISPGAPEIVNAPITFTNMNINLVKYNLDSALHLASFVLHDHLCVESKWTDNDWRAVELLCSVMEQYFSKSSISIPSQFNYSERNILLHRDIITAAVRVQYLSPLWNVSQCVDMLLLCGRLQEASRFADAVGSWKAAVGIGAVIEKVRAFSSSNSVSPVNDLLKARFRSLLPPWLRLGVQEHKKEMVKDEEIDQDLFDYIPESFAAHLVDLFTAGVMTGYDIGLWGAKELLLSLKMMCRDLLLIEDEGLYLPAPPLYLPQPTPSDELQSNAILRQKLSVQIRLLLTLFHSVGAMQHLLVWYANKLQNDKSEIRSSSKSTSKSQSKSDDYVIVRESAALATIFRDVCAILWMLHAREKLNIAVRKYQVARAESEPLSDVIEESLLWCSHFKPFAKFLNCELELESLVLCLCSGKTADRRLASLLAYYFCDGENVNPKLQPRLNVVMQRLRQTLVPMKSPRSDDSSTIDQPLSVLYQKQCRVMLKKQQTERTLQHLFIKQTDESKEDDDNLDFQLSSLKVQFFFETETVYQYFIVKIFDVLAAKSDNLNRSFLQDSPTKWPEKILVGANRHAIAEDEIALALGYMQQQKYNPDRFNDGSILEEAPRHFSTPKQIRQNPKILEKKSARIDVAGSADDSDYWPDAKMVETLALNNYFTDSPLANFGNQDADERTQGVLDRLQRCKKFEISDVFPAMRKRFYRLLPYLTWLHYWMEKEVSYINVQLKPSIRVVATKQQLMQSLFIAEVRFGGFSEHALNGLLSTRSSVTTVSKIEVQPSAGPAEPPEEDAEVNSEETAEEKTVTLQERPSIISSEEDDGSSTIEEVAEITDTIAKEEDIPVDEVAAPEMEETKPKTLDDISSRLTSLHKEEESLSEYADGGSSRKHREKSSTKRDNNLAGVVRDEIHNVLLAQQVSLLSQILLGQTLSGSNQGIAQMSSVAEILRNMQGSQAQVGEKDTQNLASNTQPQPSCSPMDKENFEPETNTLRYVEQPIQERSIIRCGRSMRRRRCDEVGIPLFHVPGITNSQEPKEIRLVRTPKSKQAWAASFIANERSPSPTRVRAPKLLRPQQPLHIQSAYASVPPYASGFAPQSHVQSKNLTSQSTKPQVPLSPPKIPPPAPQVAAPPPPPSTAPVSPYKTAYPILTKPVAPGFIPVRPTFQEQAFAPAPQQNRPAEILFSHTAANASTHRAPLINPPAQRPFCASFIDPREVIAYHTKKKVFASAKHPSSSLFKTIKPLPVLQLPPSEPPFRQRSPSPEPPSDETKISKSPPEAEEKPKAKKFDGYLDQEQVNKEVLLLMNQLSDSAVKLTQANAHLLAAAGKQAPPKPRMVEAGSQAVVEEEEEEEEEDYKDKLTTKPLPPPPDIFDRVRGELFSPTKARENEFLHVGDVSIDAVTRGLPHKPITVAEAHLKAAKQQPCLDMSHVTGFPDEKEKERPESLLTKQVEEATRVSEVREVTRDRWLVTMQNMEARLQAMDAMARNMQDDFKAASKIADTIDTMGEMMSPEKIEKPSTRSDVTTMTSPRSHQSPRRISTKPEYNREYREYSPQTPLISLKTDSYKKRLQEAHDLASLEHTPPPRPTYKPTANVKDEETVPKQMVHILDDSPPVRDVTESFDEEEIESTTTEEDRTLMDYKENIESPPLTKPRSSARKKSRDLHAKPWNQKSELEKEKVREWMRRKQRQQSAQYVDGLRKLKEAEARPFQRGGVPKSTQSLKLADDERRAKQRAMLSTHMSARIDESMQLMDQIQHDEASNKKTLRSPLRETNGRRYNQAKKPLSRPAPYPRQTRIPITPSASLSDNFDNISNSSIMSAWSVNEDVKRILYGSNTVSRRSKVKSQVTFDLDRQSYDERSVDAQSRGTASLLDDMDWQAVDALVASLDGTSD